MAKGFQLGKKQPRVDKRTLQFRKYLMSGNQLPTVYTNERWGQKVVDWGMMKNDVLGNCTIATAGHMVMQWTSDASQEVVIPDSEIVKAYSAICGYDPVTGNNDDGCYALDVLNYWRKTGIGGHQTNAFVQLDTNNVLHAKTAIRLFGSAFIGLQLPLSAYHQWLRRTYWSVLPVKAENRGPVREPGSWGGHAVPIVGYDKHGFTIVTWGRLWHITYKFYEMYCDEAYAVLSNDWLTNNGKAPNGFNFDALNEDLSLLKSKSQGPRPNSNRGTIWNMITSLIS